MHTTLESLEAEVMRLSPEERSRLLDRLVRSLDADSENDAAWDEHAEARDNELRAGLEATVPLEAVLSELESRFPR